MIYTVTLNPSLDYIVGVDNFETGKINRTRDELILPGGKGINVSIVLRNLGVESVPLGFTAGFTGESIIKLLAEEGINGDFTNCRDGLSRINVKLRSFNGETSMQESEINGQGPNSSDEELELFYKKIDGLEDGDMIILSGSVPSSLPSSIYRDILSRLENRNIVTVVDASKDLLVNVLDYQPFLIKPNNIELGEIFDAEIASKEAAIIYARKLQEMGARNVLVSMAGDGAVFVTEEGQEYMLEAHKGTVVNSVGAGDSMVAGFIYGLQFTGDMFEAFKYGLAAGSASVFSEKLATKEAVLWYYNKGN